MPNSILNKLHTTLEKSTLFPRTRTALEQNWTSKMSIWKNLQYMKWNRDSEKSIFMIKSGLAIYLCPWSVSHNQLKFDYRWCAQSFLKYFMPHPLNYSSNTLHIISPTSVLHSCMLMFHPRETPIVPNHQVSRTTPRRA